MTVTITNVNEPPVVRRSSGTGPFSIVENSGTDVGRFVATDPEGGGVTWSLATSGDHGRFEIDAANGALSFKELPDFESDDLGIDEAYTVTVRATEVDDGDTQTLELTGRLAVTVAVTDVNEPPTVTGNATPSVDENTTAVATYSATDPEEVPPSWSLQGGAGVFMITSAGALAFTTAPNYEVESSYTVTVRASDGVNTTNHPVTVTVTDVDEDEELLLSARRPLIGADYTAAFKEGMGDAVQSPTWVWARSMSRSGAGTDITGATAATYRPVGADRDNYLRVTVSYDDGHSAKTLQATSELPTLPDIMHEHAAGVPEPPVRGRRDRPLGRRERDRGNGRRPGAAGDRPGARHAQLLPRGYRLHHRSAVRDQRHLKADPGRRRRRTRSRGPGQVQRHGDGGGRIHRHGNGHVRHHH